jgi:hypothetical protein
MRKRERERERERENPEPAAAVAGGGCVKKKLKKKYIKYCCRSGLRKSPSWVLRAI